MAVPDCPKYRMVMNVMKTDSDGIRTQHLSSQIFRFYHFAIGKFEFRSDVWTQHVGPPLQGKYGYGASE